MSVEVGDLEMSLTNIAIFSDGKSLSFQNLSQSILTKSHQEMSSFEIYCGSRSV